MSPERFKFSKFMQRILGVVEQTVLIIISVITILAVVQAIGISGRKKPSPSATYCCCFSIWK